MWALGPWWSPGLPEVRSRLQDEVRHRHASCREATEWKATRFWECLVHTAMLRADSIKAEHTGWVDVGQVVPQWKDRQTGWWGGVHLRHDYDQMKTMPSFLVLIAILIEPSCLLCKVKLNTTHCVLVGVFLIFLLFNQVKEVSKALLHAYF